MNPERIVISRTVDKVEHVKLLDILSSILDDKKGDSYYYIDIGDVVGYDIEVYSFSENLIEWDCEVLNIGPRAATMMEGRYPNFLWDLNYLLYRHHIGDIKRYIALTSDYIMAVTSEPPEIFVNTFAQAVDFFTKVADIKGVIDIYEEDDREEGQDTI